MSTMQTRYAFQDTQFEVCRTRPPNHPMGMFIAIPGDLRQYEIQPGQRWMPHVVKDVEHIVNIGDMLTPNSWMRKYVIPADTVFVSNIRSFCHYRSDGTLGIRQVELLGMPCRWFAIGVFEEYDELIKNDKIKRYGERTLTMCG